MKKKYQIIGFLAIVVFLFLSNSTSAQNIKPSGNKNSFAPFQANTYNFTSFTLRYHTPTREWLLHNKAFINHPDAGFLTKDNPANAIEIIADRTNDSRYFIDKDTTSKFYIVKSNIDINYKKNGQWLSIDKRLCAKEKNIYEASHQQEPVGFDVVNKISYIKTFYGPVNFNNWQLIGENGSNQTLLAIADWSHFSAGDDGIKITDIFPGIDAKMIVDKGSIKTNFIVKQNQFKGYGRLIFTDDFNTTQPGILSFSNDEESKGSVDFIVGNKALVQINSANMYIESKPVETNQPINYRISGNRLSLLIKENDLDNMLSAGTVLIDPEVNSTDSIPKNNIGGSMNDGSMNLSCNYNLVMSTPAKATFTDVAFQFGFNTYAPATNSEGFAAIGLGNCNTGIIGANPNDTGYLQPGYASTMGQWAYISDSLLSCLPPPACAPQTVTFVLQFFNSVPFGPDSVCSNQYVNPHEAFQILIEGYTLELNHISSPKTICQASNTILSATGMYGVPPYTYSWNNGGGNGSRISVSPSTTTNYTVTITDQCGDTVTGSTLITVVPQVTPSITINTPDTSICLGIPATFSAISTGGGSNPSYQWKLNGNDVGTNSTTYTDNAPVNGDKVSCILTSNANCLTAPTAVSNIIKMNVIIQVTPSVVIAASANNVCGEIPITFNAVATNVGPSPSYQWQVNGINVGSNDSIYTSNSLVSGDVVSCIVSVSNTGCYTKATATSNTITMDIKPIPIVVLTASDTVIARGDTSKLNAVITGGYSSFAWIPTTGLSDPSITNPVASPLITTSYQINVTDTDGCITTDSILIQVYDKIFIPNAFTPDGRFNKYFRVPPTISFNLTDFSIYNRWGTKIFETSDITNGWDGTFQGNKCDMGTYVYIITGSDARGKVCVKGSVTLIR
jgi:gliding motility-associated-like protein